jgi:hypothetical protein
MFKFIFKKNIRNFADVFNLIPIICKFQNISKKCHIRPITEH